MPAELSHKKNKIERPFLCTRGRTEVVIPHILSMVKEFNEGAGIVIHTVGLSGSQDAYLMRNLAESNGGIYTAQ